jgi:hypothetical protein
MENRPDIPRGSCPRALWRFILRADVAVPLDSGQAPATDYVICSMQLVERKVLFLLCAQTLKGEVRAVAAPTIKNRECLNV